MIQPIAGVSKTHPFALPGYELAETLSEGPETAVYRGKELERGLTVVLKVAPAFASEQRRTRLRNEFALLKELDCPEVVRVLDLVEHERALVLVEEDIGGVSLHARLGNGSLKLEEFFPVALGLARALDQVHRRQIIHSDINPHNVIWNAASGRLQLIDFGWALRQSRGQAQRTAPDHINGALPYLAPEQTGRMNRAVDYRADFYALGTTFYELLTGQLPFAAADALEWVHCHIARLPRGPVEVVPALPQQLSDLVLKLLSKLAEDRYQMAAGLRSDLERCQGEWEKTGRIDAFPLGKADVSDHFQLPQKLYGREAEVATLLAAFDRMAATGQLEVLLVSGYSGAGKSALVAEVHKPVVVRRGYFISGKCDQYQKGTPYASVTVAFRMLIEQLLSESEARVADWRQRLLAALGANGRLVIDLIPQVELIVGAQPPVTDLPPDQAQRRLLNVFERFVGVFADEAHPLVIFLDDLQWIDGGSLKLITRLSTGAATHHLLLLGAYRDNEVSAEHPLMTWLEALRLAEVSLRTITLAPLSRGHMVEIVADTMHCKPEEAAPLADLVLLKTHGNPFFSFQFLLSLFHDGLLVFDRELRCWTWDFAAIQARNFTDNVVEFMLGELRRLPSQTLAALTVAGFLGNEFELGRLALVIGESEGATAEVLWPALQTGLVVQQGMRVRFLHDRVQEAAYTLTPVSDQAAIHAHIGRLLHRHLGAAELEEEVFDLVEHLNKGRAFFVEPGEQRQLVELNLRAGHKARAAAVYAAATTYLRQGIDLLPANAWISDYPLAFALHLARAECEYLVGHFTFAEDELRAILQQARSSLDRAETHLIQMMLCMARGDNAGACEIMQVSLLDLGLALSPQPTREEAEAAHAEVAALMAGRPIEQLLDLPEMTVPEMKMALRILVLGSTPAFFLSNNLWSYQDAQMVLLCLRYGVTEASVMAISYYGYILAYFNRQQEGYRFCESANALMERSRVEQHRGNAFYNQALVALWSRPLSECITLIKNALPWLIEYGALITACLGYRFIVLYSLLRGDSLEKVNEEAERCRIFAAKAPYPMVMALNRATQNLIQELRGLPEEEACDGSRALSADMTDRVPFVIVAEHLSSLTKHYVMARFSQAYEALRGAEPVMWAVPGLLPNHDYYYYGSLTLAIRYTDALPEEQAAYLATIRANEEQLRIWSENQPATFSSSHLLVKAEITRLSGRFSEAMALYEQSIAAARTNNLFSHEALACEAAARMYQQQGVSSVAEFYRRAARSAYMRWGAYGKVRQLESQYPEICGLAATELSPSVRAGQVQLDILAVVKATRAISREIVGDALLKTLLETVLEQAGGQFGALLLSKENELQVTALAEVAGQQIEVRLASAIDQTADLLPRSIIAYVHRTSLPVVLDDTRSVHSFSADPVLKERGSLAVLCLPILHQGRLLGALYLEHLASTHVFSLDRRAILEQLAAQAAVSLQNAELYARSVESEKVLRRQSRRLQLLNEIDRAIIETASLDRICAAVLEGVLGLLPANRGGITLYDEKRTETLRYVVEKQEEGLRRVERVPKIAEVPNLFPAEGVAVIEDIRLLDDPHPIVDQLREIGVVSVLSAPITAAGLLSGRLTFGADEADIFTAEHCAIAAEAAAQLSIAVRHHQLQEQQRLHAIELEQRVEQRTTELRTANQELESFSYSISHDLRAPLRAIDYYSKALAAENYQQLDAEGKRRCEYVRTETKRMGQLIDDLLAFARLGRAALRAVTVDMEQLAAAVFEEVARDEDRTRLDFQLGALPPALGDPSILRQVWVNLLSNAVKYSGKKERAVVIVEGERIQDMVKYRVQDNGAGFDMKYAKKLFGVFQRLHTEEEFTGTGIGLAIVQRIVQRHGGGIEAESAVDAGATFTFTLRSP